VSGGAPPGDQARVSVRVDAPPERAFRLFHEELDSWWLRGLAYRTAGLGASALRLEPRVGGRLVETVERAGAPREVVTGRVLAWEPPARLAFEWRGPNFAKDERTEVEVTFAASGAATLVTVTHRGWSTLRADHPARHDLEPAPFLGSLGVWWGQLLGSLRRHAAARGTE